MSGLIQTWVKVNARVDEGIAEVIAILSEVEGLQTIASCQGELVRNDLNQDIPAYVFFYLGDWQTISEFAFGKIAPVLDGIDGATVGVEIFGGGDPRAKLAVLEPELPRLAAALRRAIRHRSVCSHDTGRTEPRSY